jgi:hypothetical protein
MALTDDELLDFDEDRLQHYSAGAGGRLLAEHGDVYRAQLVAARWIDSWREGLREAPVSSDSDETRKGIDYALREVAAHLRQGDLAPGGVLYDETLGA